MCSERSTLGHTSRHRSAWILVTASVVLLAACDEVPPRTYADFMEDRIAREGTLARCNEDNAATLNDIECANARRAATAIALREERERREALERESERKLAALRDEMAWRAQAERDAAAAAEAAAQAAYEAFWRENSRDDLTDSSGAEVEGGAIGEVPEPVSADPDLDALPPSDSSAAPSDVQELSIPRPYRRGSTSDD